MSATATAPRPGPIPSSEALSAQLARASEILRELKRRRITQKFYWWKPWPKQKQVMGMRHKVIAMLGGNRVGKSVTGAFWLTCHLTGIYPDWWTGVKYAEPVDCWAVGETVQTTRDIVQKELLGDPKKDGDWGSGMIPGELIEDIRRLAGSTDSVDTAYIKHVSGGLSTCGFKTMEQGRSKLQGTKKHAIWMDEEPKKGGGYDILSEARRRTMTIKDENGADAGQVFVTYTPLYGMSDLCRYILQTEDESVAHVSVTWDDAPHLSEEEKAKELASMLPHEIEARTKGMPVIKDGLVYPFADSEIIVEPFRVPESWFHVAGLDVAGYNGYTAAILLATDPKTKVTYVVGEYCEKGKVRDDHEISLREWGLGLYYGCDPSGNRTEVDGTKTIPHYRKRGMNIHNAKNDVEEGVTAVGEALKTGKLKIFKSLTGLREEMRFYQYVRDVNGTPKIRKKDDHRLDALRYGFMALANARPLSWFASNHVAKYGSGGSNGRSGWKPGDSRVGY